jgi:hypothetical protein
MPGVSEPESFLAAEPIDAVDARRFVLPPQQDEQPTIAEAAPFLGKVA